MTKRDMKWMDRLDKVLLIRVNHSFWQILSLPPWKPSLQPLLYNLFSTMSQDVVDQKVVPKRRLRYLKGSDPTLHSKISTNSTLKKLSTRINHFFLGWSLSQILLQTYQNLGTIHHLVLVSLTKNQCVINKPLMSPNSAQISSCSSVRIGLYTLVNI